MMKSLLEDTYYKIQNVAHDPSDPHHSTFNIALIEDCDIYAGHFPSHPVCPAVCNMQLIRECAEKLTGHTLHISKIRKSRFTAILTPNETCQLIVDIQLINNSESVYDVTAVIKDSEKSYVEFQGTMTKG